MTESTKKDWNTYWEREEHQAPLTHNHKLMSVLCSLGDVQNKVILEVGAGTGRDSVYLASLGALVYALDYSYQSLKLIKTLYPDRCGIPLPVAGNAFGLPFPPNSVDVIFHQGLLEHYRNPEILLQEQRRVLKSGGYVIIDVPQKYTLYSLRKHIAMWRGRWFSGWETEYSPAELEKLVADCGFELRLTYGWGMALSYGWTMQKLVTRLKTSVRTLLKPPSQLTSLITANQDSSSKLEQLAGRVYLHLVDSVGVVAQKA
jgi:ubiquinone/menaquinone biosynthesis C-methylase UbiE